MSEKAKNQWNERSDEYFKRGTEDYPKIIENPEKAFPINLYPLIKKYTGDLKNKKICVPSSGDNIAAFGFYLLGAKVTSCDIAENQLKNAKIIADQYNFDYNRLEFICQDSMKLEKIQDDEYDLVYTSNGAHIWIDDLTEMYKNFHRILKSGGYNIFFETHPMIRPFDSSTYDVKINKLYEDVGPHDDGAEYEWRTQDFVNAICSAGFAIQEMQEFHSLREDLHAHNYLYIIEEHKDRYSWHGDTFDWKVNPWAALPQCLCICSKKV